ncbi:MAG: hypothetical protein J7604_00720 [Sporocytophaga sp.]|uniref:hypothetical protein n=1 Tax=Sporocytophaga sp. TaxID=2231183 RepID=UPI001B199A37|nr:hypothetical protein [Sporocytophaga sp.]MBO9698693.1 hypothetical protein [Sporocytophaga sp.]
MIDLSLVGKRLKQFLDTKRMKINELGKASDTAGTQIYNIIKGKKYGVDKFISVVREVPDLNLYWLLFEEGEMYKNDHVASDIKDKPEYLKMEIENLKSLISYQELTLNVYKKSLEMAVSTNEDLKELLDFYQKLIEKEKDG